MRKRFLLATITCASLTLGLLLLLGAQAGPLLADPGILYVAPGGNCGSAAPCYSSVQAAVDSASSGNEIRVAAGAYTGVSARGGSRQVVYLGKSVAIRGGYQTTNWQSPAPQANPAVLDAQGQGRVFTISGDVAPTIEGLWITGGNATSLGGYFGTDVGGGLLVVTATVTLRDNRIYENGTGLSGHGGGLFLFNSDSTLQSNKVYSNTAGDFGGGVYLASGAPQLSGNVIEHNDATAYGGGIYMEWSEARVRGNKISGNSASQGGGIYLYYGSWASLENNSLRSNTANHGAGLTLFRSDTSLSGNTIARNYDAVEGGGLWMYQSDPTLDGDLVYGNKAHRGAGLHVWDSGPTLTNAVIIDNQGPVSEAVGSGLYAKESSLRMLHTTIARNFGGDGSGIHLADSYGVGSTAHLTNTIVSGHSRGIVVEQFSSATLYSTLWYANITDLDGAGSISRSHDYHGDPAFAADGYHLTSISAAKDVGVDAGVTTDIDGQAQPRMVEFEMGADEIIILPIHIPLLLRNR